MDAVEAPTLFGRGLTPMPMGATATVVRTHTLALPTVEELTLGHAYANLPWRKRLGHTLYELVGLLASEQFLRPGRFGALVVDEAYHLVSTSVAASGGGLLQRWTQALRRTHPVESRPAGGLFRRGPQPHPQPVRARLTVTNHWPPGRWNGSGSTSNATPI